MWIVPMISAAVVSRFSPSFFAFLVCFGLLYVVHHPIVLMMKGRKPADTKELRQVGLLAVPALLMGLALIIIEGRTWLLLFGIVEAAVFGLSVKSYLDRDQRSFFNELTIVAALTLTAPAAYYVVAGTLDVNAFLLYLYNFLFFGSSVFYVKMKIEILRSKGEWNGNARHAFAKTIAYHISLVAIVLAIGIMGIASAWVLLAFVPMLIQVVVGSLSGKMKMNFKRLGFALVAQSVVFLIVVGLFMK